MDFDALLLFESGEVCIDSLGSAIEWPNKDGFEGGVVEPNIFVDGADVALGCPKMLPEVADTDDAGWLVVSGALTLPNNPPVELGGWAPKSPAEAGCAEVVCIDEGGISKMLPLNPPKPPLLAGWLGAPVFILAKGFVVPGPGPNELKLNSDAPAPPEPPKEKAVDVFWAACPGFVLAPGKLCDWPTENPEGWGLGVEGTTLGSIVLNGLNGWGVEGDPAAAAGRGRLRTSLILVPMSEGHHAFISGKKKKKKKKKKIKG